MVMSNGIAVSLQRFLESFLAIWARSAESRRAVQSADSFNGVSPIMEAERVAMNRREDARNNSLGIHNKMTAKVALGRAVMRQQIMERREIARDCASACGLTGRERAIPTAMKSATQTPNAPWEAAKASCGNDGPRVFSSVAKRF